MDSESDFNVNPPPPSVGYGGAGEVSDAAISVLPGRSGHPAGLRYHLRRIIRESGRLAGEGGAKLCVVAIGADAGWQQNRLVAFA